MRRSPTLTNLAQAAHAFIVVLHVHDASRCIGYAGRIYASDTCDTAATAALVESFRTAKEHPLHPDTLRKTFENQEYVSRVAVLCAVVRGRYDVV